MFTLNAANNYNTTINHVFLSWMRVAKWRRIIMRPLRPMLSVPPNVDQHEAALSAGDSRTDARQLVVQR